MTTTPWPGSVGRFGKQSPHPLVFEQLISLAKSVQSLIIRIDIKKKVQEISWTPPPMVKTTSQ